MEEKRGCCFCENSKWRTMVSETFNFCVLIDGDNNLNVRYSNTKEIIDEVARIGIGYCPICGRKL